MRSTARAGMPTHSKLALIGAFKLTAVVVGLDAWVIDRGAFAENVPTWSAEYWLRTLLLAGSALLAIGALVRWRRETRSDDLPIHLAPLVRLAVIAIPAGALFCVSVLIVAPEKFTHAALEDRPVEYLSFLLLLAACGFTLASTWVLSRRSSIRRRSLLVLPLLLAAGFFVTAMEEVSWFQRVLSVQTPDALAENAQGELNFHNFATTAFENGYYFGAFVALMLLPLVFKATDLRLPGTLDVFVPRRVVALGSAVAFGFNFDMWDITLSQLSFYGAVAIVGVWLLGELDSRDRWLAYYVGGATVAVQLIMLTLGDRSNLIYDATEYKEMFIPAGFALYGLDVLLQVRAGSDMQKRSPRYALDPLEAAQNG